MGVKAINALQEIWNGFDFSRLQEIFMRVIPALLCITLHELSHGAVAYALGDDTAKKAGRLTLNPIKHLDVMGLLMMVIFGFGYAKPVPVDMMKFKNPKRGMAITALAGPVSNVAICAVFLFLYGLLYYPLRIRNALGAFGGGILEIVYITAYISIAMGIFNLLPIPPLDGSKVLYSVLPNDVYYRLMRYERYGMILLLLLVWTDLVGSPLSAAVEWSFDKLFNVAQWGFDIVKRFI